MRIPVRISVALALLFSALVACQKGGYKAPDSLDGTGARTSTVPAGVAAPEARNLLERHAALLKERMSGEDLEVLTRDWPRATELPGRPESWKRVGLTDAAGAAPDGFRYAAMVDRGDPYVYWIEVSSSARGILEYRGPSRIE